MCRKNLPLCNVGIFSLSDLDISRTIRAEVLLQLGNSLLMVTMTQWKHLQGEGERTPRMTNDLPLVLQSSENCSGNIYIADNRTEVNSSAFAFIC